MAAAKTMWSPFSAWMLPLTLALAARVAPHDSCQRFSCARVAEVGCDTLWSTVCDHGTGALQVRAVCPNECAVRTNPVPNSGVGLEQAISSDTTLAAMSRRLLATCKDGPPAALVKISAGFFKDWCGHVNACVHACMHACMRKRESAA